MKTRKDLVKVMSQEGPKTGKQPNGEIITVRKAEYPFSTYQFEDFSYNKKMELEGITYFIKVGFRESAKSRRLNGVLPTIKGCYEYVDENMVTQKVRLREVKDGRVLSELQVMVQRKLEKLHDDLQKDPEVKTLYEDREARKPEDHPLYRDNV